MAKRVNQEWWDDTKEKIERTGAIEIAIGFAPAAKRLVLYLDSKDIPFRVHNLGAGVKKITTDTDRCPCCRRKLDEKL